MGKYVKDLYTYDKSAWESCRVSGMVTKSQLKDLGISQTRIKNYCLDKYFEKVAYKNESGKRDYCYQLTKFGKDAGYEKWGLKSYYQTHSPLHDLAVSKAYFNSLGDYEREHCKSELESRRFIQAEIERLKEVDLQKALEFEEKLNDGRISVPDLLYQTVIEVDGEDKIVYEAVEVITGNYKEIDIQAKHEFCEVLNIKLEEVRV